MSKIDDLIKQYSPNGVEFKELNEIGTLYGGLTGKDKNDFSDGNACFITYMNIFSNISVNPSDMGFVKVGEHEHQTQVQIGDVLFTGSSETPDECGMSSVLTQKLDEPLYLNSFCFGFRPNDPGLLLPDFSKYLFRDTTIRRQIIKSASGVTRFNISKKRFVKMKIPIPPIEVQKEIANTLDKFTSLEAELETELELRKRQYEFYQGNLLKTDDDVELISLQDLCTLITDGSHTSPKSVDDGYYMPSVKDMRFNGFDFSSCKKISKEDYELLVKNGCRPQKNDVLIAKDGSMLKYAFPVEEEEDLVVLSSIAIFRPKIDIINPKYLAHFFRQDNFKAAVIRNFSSKGGVPRIILKNFKKVRIPVPPITEQNQIVSILDTFDHLINDTSNGLPAEIKARHHQYEYYRDKLLTFTELPV